LEIIESEDNAMKRFCYRGQYHSPQIISFIKGKKDHVEALLRTGRIYTATVFAFDNQNIFVYYECVDEELSPLEILPGAEAYLNKWPGTDETRWFIPMIDIYHSMQPNKEEEVHWHRTEHAVPKASMSLMRLDTLSSYIFYHVQLQEEKPSCNGKHMSIWSSEDIALLYSEKPDEKLENPHKGMLDTKNTPTDWGGVMIPHFIRREDGELYHMADIVLTMSEGDLSD